MLDSIRGFQMRYLTVIVSLFCMLFSAQAAKADRRIAFVVGNGAYKNVAQLPNPAIDAQAMAAVLRNVGFEVVEGTNLTRDKMTERLLEFGKKAQGADVAVFFYAGHGIAISGTNYLLPIDADIKSEMDVKLGAAINIDLTLDQTMSDAKVKLVFLDACRDNPFTAKIKSNSATRSVSVQSGLAEMKSGEGTLIAFATGPGQTALDGQEGTNSPFTRALIAHITSPGLEIQQAMTEVRAQVNEETSKGQLPWGHTNLIGSVYLNPVSAPVAGAAPASSARAAAVSTSAATDVELEFWRSVKESNKPEEPAQPEKKGPELILARSGFQKVYIAARGWNADARPYRLASVATSDGNGHDGKWAVWVGSFASPSTQREINFTWSGSTAQGAPSLGINRGSEDSYSPSNANTKVWDMAFLKIDSDQAFAEAQKHGGDKVLEKSPDTPVTYVCDWNHNTNELIWHVIYGASREGAKLTVSVNASTGAFIRVEK